MKDSAWEIIAYLASALIIISFLCKNQKKLRILSSCGSAIFAIYAYHRGDTPLIFINTVIVAINLAYLFQHGKEKP